jgi:hypothetical protein
LALLALEAGTKETNNMNPRPGFWHRTRRRPSFWLGLFVACFLAWAWWDSYEAQTVFRWMDSSEESIQFTRMDGASFVTVGSGIELIQYMPGWQYERTNEVPFESLWSLAGSQYWRVPDSLVFFSFLGLWVGWLAFFDWLRKKRQAGKGALP